MFEIHGKYNSVQVMLPPGNIDETTSAQLKSIADFEPFNGAKIIIMPDCHAGKGSCVGLTMRNFNVIVPNIIGVDVGCGVYTCSLPSSLSSDKDFSRFDRLLRQNIPYGFNSNSEQKAELTDETKSQIEDLALRVNTDPVRVVNSLGSLGGGNHFIEINESPKGDQIMVIHSGSRNFGLQVCNHHQALAKAYCEAAGIVTPGGLEFLPFGKGAEVYLEDMQIAQRYAEINRETMARRLLQLFCGAADLTKAYHCTHNYVTEGTIRKGAISARLNERVLIPINMRDGIIVGTGKGASEWNNSAPHGAGRVLSRSQAKKKLDIKDFQETMKGVWTSSVSHETLDESPFAYKPQKLILEAIKDTVEIEAVYKPVYNFKAGEKAE